MTRLSIAFVVLALAVSVAPRPARAQFFPQTGASSVAAGNIEGFTVTGKGTASAKPNRLEIDLEVSAASELSADAIVKYRDAKRRLEEAFTALKLENVAVEERGLLVDQKGAQMNPYFFDYQPNRKAKAEVQLTRRLVVKCAEIRKMDEESLLQLVAKLLDVAQDAGGRVGGAQNNFNPFYYERVNQSSGGLVRFILDDFDKLEEEAYAKAIANAEARAQRLAKLSRVTLGPVSAVRETSSPSDKETAQEDEIPRKRLESSRFQEIPVRVELMVRFEVAPQPAANGRPGDR
ncbi:MAG: SIMPL domain-containing protein [Isosphaeraceae bacterium]|nr:SIMPL domain-containing protein [Isosphaeraceae bacterium]